MLQIEWKSSHYHSDGRRRSRPKASTVHGWLVKWRATFSGNERLRKEGIREMREAKAVRERKKQKKAAVPKSPKPFSCLGPVSLVKERRPQMPKDLSRVSQRPSTRRQSRENTRRLTSPTQSPRPPPTNSRRNSHNRQGSGDRTPLNSRKDSYGSRRDTTKKKQ